MRKLIAKPDTWFKGGTEVLWEDTNYICRVPTKNEWVDIQLEEFAVFRGIRISESIYELQPVGTEYTDGELCLCDEFELIEDYE